MGAGVTVVFSGDSNGCDDGGSCSNSDGDGYGRG